jgi:hypothetical protein
LYIILYPALPEQKLINAEENREVRALRFFEKFNWKNLKERQFTRPRCKRENITVMEFLWFILLCFSHLKSMQLLIVGRLFREEWQRALKKSCYLEIIILIRNSPGRN